MGVCEQCGKVGKVYIHHKDFNHRNDDETNRQPSCHRLTHTIAARKSFPVYDQSRVGWSKNLSWQELLDARGYPSLNVSDL